MKKLTAEKCRDRIARLKECEKMPWGLSIDGIYQLQALEIALPVLEQQEKDGWIEWRGGEQPVSSETRVTVMLRKAGVQQETYADEWEWGWGYGDAVDQIIAYRVIEQQERERGDEA